MFYILQNFVLDKRNNNICLFSEVPITINLVQQWKNVGYLHILRTGNMFVNIHKKLYLL